MTAKHWLLAAAGVVLCVSVADAAGMKLAPTVVELKREAFKGTIDGKPVDLYTIKSKSGLTARITNYGAKIEQLLVPDRKGVFADVALGFDSLAAAQKGQGSMGAFIGRYANRIGGAKFTLDGVEYKLAANNGPNSLHGGDKGSRFQVFNARQLSDSALELVYVFKDGEENYPGTLPVRVVYAFTASNNEFTIEWAATAIEKATVANFTGHTFFNLTGDPTITNSKHVIRVNADASCRSTRTSSRPASSNPSPARRSTSASRSRSARTSARPTSSSSSATATTTTMRSTSRSPARSSSPPRPSSLTPAATMEVWTTEPGMQLFSGNNLSAKSPIDAGKGGKLFVFRGAFCMEPSRFPDGPNQPKFPSTVVKPGEWYTGKIVYKFGTK